MFHKNVVAAVVRDSVSFLQVREDFGQVGYLTVSCVLLHEDEDVFLCEVSSVSCETSAYFFGNIFASNQVMSITFSARLIFFMIRQIDE